MIAFALIGAGPAGFAQTRVEQALLSSNIHAQLAAGDGSLVAGSDQVIFDFNPESGNASILAELQVGNASLDLDALGFDQEEGAMFSVDTVATIAGMDVHPRDVLEESGAGLAFAFIGADHGVPDDVSVDAVSRDPENGELLLSFDRTFMTPGDLKVRPVGVFRFDGSNFSTEFSGSSVPENVNLDAVHLISNGNLLMSFDIDVLLPGEGGVFHAADEDIVGYDRKTGSFRRVGFRLRDIDDSWQAADVDALWADVTILGDLIFADRFEN